MVTPERIQRINELAKKAKITGLDESEKREQDLLRKEYVQAVRNSLKSNLDSIKIVDESGNVLKEYGERPGKKLDH